MPEPIVTLDEESLRTDLRGLVRGTVEDTPSGPLEEEAGDLVGAERYERTAEREAYLAGHHGRKLATTSGEVTIHMPKLKGMKLATAIIERYGVDEARRGGQGRARRIRQDADARQALPRALAEDQDQQRYREAEPRDTQANPRGRYLPRRELRPHARDSETEVRRRERVGVAPLPGRDSAGGGAAPDGGPMGMSESAQES